MKLWMFEIFLTIMFIINILSLSCLLREKKIKVDFFVKKKLKKNWFFCSDVETDLESKIPVVTFKVDGRHVCRLTLNNDVAFQTTALLKDYFDVDQRVRYSGDLTTQLI